jgi:carbon storage regulator CsrA
MLVLSRRRLESVKIGGNLVTVTVLSIEGNTVRLGFEAHPSVTVHRQEVQDAIDARTRHRSGPRMRLERGRVARRREEGPLS